MTYFFILAAVRCLIKIPQRNVHGESPTPTVVLLSSYGRPTVLRRRKHEAIVNADGLTEHESSAVREAREALAQATAGDRIFDSTRFAALGFCRLKYGAQQAADAAQRAAGAASAAADAAQRAMRKEGPADPPELRPVEQGLHPVGLVIMADQNFQGRKYAAQIQSLRCYAQQQGYDLFQSDFFYLKHCAVAEFLGTRPERYTAVVLDADVVAVVLDRGIAGPEALLRSRKPPGFSSADNGALHVMLVNVLELDGAEHVARLAMSECKRAGFDLHGFAWIYDKSEAMVDNLDPYWNFVRAGYPELYPQGVGCKGQQCAEVSNFTCFPLENDDEPLMRKQQRDGRYLFAAQHST
eukprot:Skav232409  [mRNA]  locus=scaffold4273:3963:9435:+ [translate_table: standard]